MTREERFWSKVDKSGDCWVWIAARDRRGYGRFESHPASRTAYALTYGEIPQGLCVLHRCDNPPCVNPEHLFLGTIADNNRDMAQKGRARNVPMPGSKHPGAKLNEEKVALIRHLYAAGKYQKDLAREFGVCKSNIGYVVRRETWTQEGL